MKERSVLLYFALLAVLFVSGSMVGCAQRTFDESIITAGDKDPLWQVVVARGQAFEHCEKIAPKPVIAPVKTASVRKAAPRPVSKTPPVAKAAPTPTPAPVPVEKTATVSVPGAETLFPQEAECPPGCVPISRINPAVAVPLSQTAPVAPGAPAAPEGPLTTPVPPFAPPAPTTAPALSPEPFVPLDTLGTPAFVPPPVATESLGAPVVPVPTVTAP